MNDKKLVDQARTSVIEEKECMTGYMRDRLGKEREI